MTSVTLSKYFGEHDFTFFRLEKSFFTNFAGRKCMVYMKIEPVAMTNVKKDVSVSNYKS